MCRRLFTAEFLKGEILPHSDSNNPGVEVLPVLEPEREDGQPRKRISFQCKYVDSAANAYSEFQKSAKITAKIYQGNLDLVYLFCNKTLTTSTKAYQTIVNIHAAAGIETKPVSNDELLDMIAKHEDISEYFFQQRKISESNRFNMIINGHLRQRGKVAELALGYGGSVGALKAMGALEMGVPEEELKPLVDAWRESNPNIVRLWWDVDRAVMEAVIDKSETETHGIRFACTGQTRTLGLERYR